MKVSVIIPTYRESEKLPALIDQLLPMMSQGHEVIVVNGDPLDTSVEKLEAAGVRVMNSDKGRAKQMNAGAELAQYECLWFLHADSQFTASLSDYLDALVPLEVNQWGRFDIQLDGHQRVFRIIAFMINLRSSLSGIATGDQGIFVHKTLFERVGGFAGIPIMEDVDICKKMKKIKRPNVIKLTLMTSARRWQSKGILSTVFLMWKLRLYYYLGVDPAKLSKLYS